MSGLDAGATPPVAPDDAPRLSVVIPCFNAARFLDEALASVFAQGIDDLEVVLVDDGSTDGSAEVARRHDPRVRVLAQANAGIAAARNAGVAAARGGWLAFLDADDVWTEGSLAARFAALERQGIADGVFGALQQFLDPGMAPEDVARIDFDPRPQPGRFAGTLLVRRAAFLRAGPFDTALKVGEMLDWVSRAELAGLGFLAIDTLVMRRRIHGRNTTLQQAPAQSRAEYLRALKATLDRRRAAAAAEAAAIKEAM